jgi:hypothetical protein
VSLCKPVIFVWLRFTWQTITLPWLRLNFSVAQIFKYKNFYRKSQKITKVTFFLSLPHQFFPCHLRTERDNHKRISAPNSHGIINDQHFLIFQRMSGDTGNWPVKIWNVGSEKTQCSSKPIFQHFVQLFLRIFFGENF